ncbi:hypothetical protein HAX54_032765 [Datura stramonium]|uniref:Uncharacterized protein n=1 Tax=Datura stramonium TaxID=4076 RepID=A0ABS8VBA1_DATST|nr:hypothetical protein [Datura stramonium]
MEVTTPQYGPHDLNLVPSDIIFLLRAHSLNLVPSDIILLLRAHGYLNTALTASIWSLQTLYCSCEHWVSQYGPHNLNLVPSYIILLLRAHRYLNTTLKTSIWSLRTS